MIKKYSFIAFLLLSLASCQFMSNSLSKLWFYTYSTGAATGKDTLLTPVSFLELRPDGSYTRDFGHFEYGAWTRKDQQLYLTDQQHKTYVFQLNNITSKEMQLTLAKDLTGNFESQPLPSDKPAEDPYSVENNRWRIPATHKESDEEIRQRLLNHCRFWEAYFAWALKKELEIVDVRSTPTPIKIYGNGFGLKPFENLPGTWKSYFFDEDDCRKANDMLKDIFEKKTIAWAHTDSKYKMFLSAFQQMAQFLR
jgi:hypothetical protein